MTKRIEGRSPPLQRLRALIDAAKAYGVFKWPLDDGTKGPEWLMSYFLVGWAEAWAKKDYKLMWHYLQQAEELLYDRAFGQGLNSPKIPADSGGQLAPDGI